MLAQNFMTPAELNLTDKQRAAAIELLGMMERGELRHTEIPDLLGMTIAPYGEGAEFTGHFNMSEWNIQVNCDTVCCIGGSISVLSGEPLDEYVSEELFDLCYPGGARGIRRPRYNTKHFPRLSDITPAHAAIALRNFLTTGKARWDEVFRK